MSAETLFVAMIAAQTGVTGLIGTGDAMRLYPNRLPQDYGQAAIVYTFISGPRDYTQDGADGVTTFRIQIEIYAQRYADGVTLRDALAAAISGLHNQSFGSPPAKVKGCFFEDENDHYVQETDGFNPTQYAKRLDIRFTCNQL